MNTATTAPTNHTQSAIIALSLLGLAHQLRREGRIQDSVILRLGLKRMAELEIDAIKAKRQQAAQTTAPVTTGERTIALNPEASDLIDFCLSKYDPSQATPANFSGNLPTSADDAANLRALLAVSHLHISPNREEMAKREKEAEEPVTSQATTATGASKCCDRDDDADGNCDRHPQTSRLQPGIPVFLSGFRTGRFSGPQGTSGPLPQGPGRVAPDTIAALCDLGDFLAHLNPGMGRPQA